MLAREGAKIPNPHLFIRAREAVSSSKIEGAQDGQERLEEGKS